MPRHRFPYHPHLQELIDKIRELGVDQCLEMLRPVSPDRNTVTAEVKSMEELFRRFNMSQDEWDVIEAKLNIYPTTIKDVNGKPVQVDNEQISAKVRPKAGLKTAKEVLEALAEQYAKAGPKRKRPKYTIPQRHRTLEIVITDHHLGKVPAITQYDLPTASRLYMEVIEEAVTRTNGISLSEIILPVGSDFLNVDNYHNQTTRGTPVTSSSNWQEVFKAGCQLLVQGIDWLREIAPVTVLPIPGNHDWHSAVSMGYLLQAWYRNDDAITVREPSDYHLWYDGTTNILFYHGHDIKPERLPLIMAKESPNFHAAKIQEIHTGHLHKTFKKGIEIDEFNGVRVRIFPALCPADDWHKRKGYHHSQRQSYAILWEDGVGQLAEYPIVPRSILF